MVISTVPTSTTQSNSFTLSCNWKKLQNKLREEKKAPKEAEGKLNGASKTQKQIEKEITRDKNEANGKIRTKTKEKPNSKVTTTAIKRKPVMEEQKEGPAAKRPKESIKSQPVSEEIAQGKARLGKVLKKLDGSVQEKPMTSASLALWAEDNDIPSEDLARAYGLSLATTSELPDSSTLETTKAFLLGGKGVVNDAAKKEAGKYIAIDCEMVGVGGPDAGSERSVLARVSIVNFHGHTLLDSFVQPKEKVTDWRTRVSGVRPSDMAQAKTFEEIQHEVASLLKNRILVGHAIRNDLEVLLLSHPRRDIRDTSQHSSFRKLSKGRTPGLKKLAKEILGIEIQGGEHSSVDDARACMLLYRKFKHEFEQAHALKYPIKIQKAEGEGSSDTKDKKKKKKKKKKK